MSVLWLSMTRKIFILNVKQPKEAISEYNPCASVSNESTCTTFHCMKITYRGTHFHMNAFALVLPFTTSFAPSCLSMPNDSK